MNDCIVMLSYSIQGNSGALCPNTPAMHPSEQLIYLFLLCLYVNFFLVLSPTPKSVIGSLQFFPSWPFLSWRHYQACGWENSRRELPQLVPYHILRDYYIIVDLPVVYLELQPHKIGQYCRCAGHGFDGRCSLARDGAHDRETGPEGNLDVSKSAPNDEETD